MREKIICQLFSNTPLHLHWRVMLGWFWAACPLWFYLFWVVAFHYIVLIPQLCQTCFSLYGYSLLAFHHCLPILIVNRNLKLYLQYDMIYSHSFLKAQEWHLTFSNDWTGWSLFWLQWNLSFSVWGVQQQSCLNKILHPACLTTCSHPHAGACWSFHCVNHISELVWG